MKASDDLVDYVEKRYTAAKKLRDENKPHSEETFNHIYAMGLVSALEDLLSSIDEGRIS